MGVQHQRATRHCPSSCWCGRSFASTRAFRRHQRDTGHVIGPEFDSSSSYNGDFPEGLQIDNSSFGDDDFSDELQSDGTQDSHGDLSDPILSEICGVCSNRPPCEIDFSSQPEDIPVPDSRPEDMAAPDSCPEDIPALSKDSSRESTDWVSTSGSTSVSQRSVGEFLELEVVGFETMPDFHPEGIAVLKSEESHPEYIPVPDSHLEGITAPGSNPEDIPVPASPTNHRV